MTLKVAFTDFWKAFDPDTEWLVRVLRTRLDFEITRQPAEADLLLASCFGNDHLQFDCTRVFVCWENQAWPRSRFDWAFSGDYVASPRHHRLPLWVVHLDLHPEHTIDHPEDVLAAKSRFAAMVVSSPHGAVRNRLHELLDAYKPVASGGRYKNNVGGPVDDKMAFISTAKFTFACEGSSHPGYTTEKLIHGLAADTVPIYWGNPRVGEEFNSRRFINFHDFPTERAFIERIIEVDRNDGLYLDMLREPWFRDGVLPRPADKKLLLDQFERIVAWTGTPVAQRSRAGRLPSALADRYRARQRFAERRQATTG